MFLKKLESIIEERLNSSSESSYVYALFNSGIDRVLKKIAEEAGEVIIASKNACEEEIKNEVADLLFHILIMLAYHKVGLDDIMYILKERHYRTKISEKNLG